MKFWMNGDFWLLITHVSIPCPWTGSPLAECYKTNKQQLALVHKLRNERYYLYRLLIIPHSCTSVATIPLTPLR